MNWNKSPLLILAAAPALCFQTPEQDAATQARGELYAARYTQAVELYQKAIIQQPSGDSYYGLTRALLEVHRPKEAYAAASEALKLAPPSPGALTAAGLAMFRKGEIVDAENDFRAALKLDPKYPGALRGLASIYAAISKSKTSRELSRQAYAARPDDPMLMLARANTLSGAEHIAALVEALAKLDPESEDARGLRAHIASDRASAGKKLRRLVSPYQPERIKLVRVGDDPRRQRGFGVRVQFNQSYTATLLLDTGASGISLEPKAAQKAGLELLTDEASEAKGIGDKAPQESHAYIAPEVRIGNVVFADHPVKVFRGAHDSDHQGLIGADVFQRFLVNLDFPAFQVNLKPFPAAPSDDPEDTNAPPEGFTRVIRSGNHLLIATSVNQSPAKWFLIDSGASSNLVDAEGAREFTGVGRDSMTTVHGIQGKVDKVSRADRITLVFAGFRQENPNLLAINLQKMSDDMGINVTGVIGMPVLQQLNLAIDYRSGAIRLERPK